MSGGDYATAIAWLAANLSHFRHYPPERCITDGDCYACGKPVHARQGMFATGSEGGGIFGVYLHATPCLADVRKARAAAGDKDAKVPAPKAATS